MHAPADARTLHTRHPLLPLHALTNVLWWSLVTSVVLGVWILVDRNGWSYYATPLGVRGYHPMHKALRPTGQIAHLLGTGGWLMMLVPLLYQIRKRVKAFASWGAISTWLDVHIFCGIVGPVLVTFHTSFKFNGLISVAYWSMVAVALSGFIGRYLYVRIPRTLRGVELSHDDIVGRVAELRDDIAHIALPDDMRALVDGAGAARSRRTRRALRHTLIAHGVAADRAAGIIALLEQRDQLADRMRALARRQRLFGLWHVFHLPLVWIMFAIVALHVGLALYLGYWPI